MRRSLDRNISDESGLSGDVVESQCSWVRATSCAVHATGEDAQLFSELAECGYAEPSEPRCAGSFAYVTVFHPHRNISFRMM